MILNIFLLKGDFFIKAAFKITRAMLGLRQPASTVEKAPSGKPITESKVCCSRNSRQAAVVLRRAVRPVFRMAR